MPIGVFSAMPDNQVLKNSLLSKGLKVQVICAHAGHGYGTAHHACRSWLCHGYARSPLGDLEE